MKPQYLAAIPSRMDESEAFWPQPADTHNDACQSEIISGIVARRCGLRVRAQLERGVYPFGISRRNGCQRASNRFWPLALSSLSQHVRNSSKKKLFLLKSPSWLSRFLTNTKTSGGRGYPAPQSSHLKAGSIAQIGNSVYSPLILDQYIRSSRCQFHPKFSVGSQPQSFLRGAPSSNKRLRRSRRNPYMTNLAALSDVKGMEFSTPIVKPTKIRASNPLTSANQPLAHQITLAYRMKGMINHAIPKTQQAAIQSDNHCLQPVEITKGCDDFPNRTPGELPC